MPTVDMTATVANGARSLLARVKERVKEKVFLGPDKIKLSPKEALERLRSMTPDERMTLVRERGRDVLMDEIDRLLIQEARKR